MRYTPNKIFWPAATALLWAAVACAPLAAWSRDGIEARRLPGRGADVILVSGLSATPDVWHSLARKLRSRYRVHVVTLSATCEGSLPGGAPPLLAASQALERYLAGLRAPATVVAHSAGGVLALELSTRRPTLFQRLVVVDAVPAPGVLLARPGTERREIVEMANAQLSTMLNASPAERVALLHRERSNAVKSADHAHHLTRVASACDTRSLAVATRDLLQMDLRASLVSAKVPLTVVYADQASLGAPKGWMLSRYQGLYDGYAGPARFIEVPDARHYLMLDQPQQFSEIISDALSANTP